MSGYDKFTLGLTLIGIAINIVLAFVSQGWRDMHRNSVLAGHLLGFILLGIGLYMLVLSVIPLSWGLSMGPKISMVIGAVLLIGGAVWQFTSPTGAQTASGSGPSSQSGPTVIENSGGGVGADITVNGSRNGTPTIGMDTNGLKIIQNGPGTGMRVIVNPGNGPTTGVRSIITPGQ